MANDTEEMIVNDVIREFGILSGSRGTWESHWEEIAERILPEHRSSMRYGSFTSPGERRTEGMLDSTGALALSRFAAIMSSILTPGNWVWHKIKATDDNLMKSRRVKLYFDAANIALWQQRRRPSANFSGQKLQCYQSLGAYGTSALLVDRNWDEGGIRYKYMHIGRTYIGENHQGQVNRFIGFDHYKAYQLYERKAWRDKLPASVTEALTKNPMKEYTVLHCVKPRGEDYDPNRLDARGKKFVSYYVLQDTKTLLQSGGYSSFPMPVGRYEQAMDECYGRSPAMLALPSLKTLNQQKATVLKQGERIVDPALFTEDDGFMDDISVEAGAINSGGMRDGKMQVGILPTGNLAIARDMMQDERAIINDVFLVSLFQILVETPQMTATEVMERTREKGILLAPTAGRQQDEDLGSMIPRELEVLALQGLLPDMPPELIEAKGEFQTEYDNDLTRSARAQEAAGFARVVEQAVAIATQTADPSILDHFDFDTAIPEISALQGVPERWMSDVDTILNKRQQRQQQTQQQTAIQAAPGLAALQSSQAKLSQSGAK